jgi:hypothetical protein
VPAQRCHREDAARSRTRNESAQVASLLAVYLLHIDRPGNGPARASELALELFSDDLLEHLLVETQIGDELLEAAILMLELLETT